MCRAVSTRTPVGTPRVNRPCGWTRRHDRRPAPDRDLAHPAPAELQRLARRTTTAPHPVVPTAPAEDGPMTRQGQPDMPKSNESFKTMGTVGGYEIVDTIARGG